MTAKKMLLLTTVALAAMVLAIPASASAGKWKDKGVFLNASEHATLVFSGKVELEYKNATNVLTCNASFTLTAEGGETGTITKFDLETASCSGIGIFAKCTVKTDKFSTLPLVVHTTAVGFEITKPELNIEYNEGVGCTLVSSVQSFPSILATANKLEPIASVTLFGKDSLGVTSLKGSLNAADPKTLGIV
jgi:hypothetical protein